MFFYWKGSPPSRGLDEVVTDRSSDDHEILTTAGAGGA